MTADPCSRWVDAVLAFAPHESLAKGALPRGPMLARFDTDARAALARARHAALGTKMVIRSLDDEVDEAVLRAHATTSLACFEDWQWHRHNPRMYVEAWVESLEAIGRARWLSRDERRRARAQALVELPAAVDVAVAQLEEPMRPFVAPALEVIGELGLELRGYGDAGLVPLEVVHDARSALERMGEALERAPTVPFKPMGRDRYAALLRERHHLERDLDTLEALAEETLARTRAQLADQLPSAASIDTQPPPSFGREEVLAYYADEVEAVRAFIVARDLVTLPEIGLELAETPAHLAASSPPVFYEPPPAFAHGVGRFYFVPVPETMDDKERAYHWDRVRHRRLRTAIAHEVWPGHHCHLARVARHRRAIRKYRDDEICVEGWGLYSETLMREEGLWGDDAPVRSLRSLAFRAARVIADIDVHTGRRGLEDAGARMAASLGVPAGSDWVVGEIARYAADPGQALAYLIGQDLIMALRADLFAAGWTAKGFHDAFIDQGAIPVPLIASVLARRPPR